MKKIEVSNRKKGELYDQFMIPLALSERESETAKRMDKFFELIREKFPSNGSIRIFMETALIKQTLVLCAAYVHSDRKQAEKNQSLIKTDFSNSLKTLKELISDN